MSLRWIRAFRYTTEETEAKSEENLKKVAEMKNLLDNGITAANVADALTSLASFISSK